MHSSSNLVHHLPFLRRYARALVGNQKVADAAVLSTFASLQASPSISTVAEELSSRETLFRRFSEFWNGPAGSHLDSLASNASPQTSVEKRIAALPHLARQAFLLVALEDFNDEQLTRILDIPSDKLQAVKEIARDAVAEQVATDVLIIEDEMFIADDLEAIANSLGHDVIAIERTRDGAVRAAEKKSPGLVLADIQLADGSSGIDAANEILTKFRVPVIFITAYPERLLTGLRPEPTFVLTKPFKSETVRAIISQALFFEMKAHSGTNDSAANGDVETMPQQIVA